MNAMQNTPMGKAKPKISFAAICRCAFVIWVLLLSALVFSILGTTNRLMHHAASGEQSIHLKALESEVIQLSAQLAAQQSALHQKPYAYQADLDRTRQEFLADVDALGVQLEEFASQAEMQMLQGQLEALSGLVQKLQEAITTRLLQQTAVPAVVPAATSAATPVVTSATNRSARAVQPQRTPAQPFKILGSELRGGERFLSVMPANNGSIESIMLLGAGHSISNWVLESIDDTTATFKVGSQVRRLVIPQ